jgi:hypothetical protein
MDIAGRDTRATAFRNDELQAEDRAKLRGLLRATALFAELDKNMPLQMLRTFLLVATEEGPGTVEYSKKVDVANKVMARHLSELGEFSRFMEYDMGHELVHQKADPADRRNRKAYLTSKGHEFGHRLLGALGR